MLILRKEILGSYGTNHALNHLLYINNFSIIKRSAEVKIALNLGFDGD